MLSLHIFISLTHGLRKVYARAKEAFHTSMEFLGFEMLNIFAFCVLLWHLPVSAGDSRLGK